MGATTSDLVSVRAERRAEPLSRAAQGAGWLAIATEPAPGAWNMAVDEASMEAVRAGGPPLVRFYRWSPACVSLGRNQPAAGRYDLRRLVESGVEVVRRPTGGRAVLHDQELTYAVVARTSVLGSPRASYSRINRALVAGLRLLGVPAALQPPSDRRAATPSLEPCFRQAAEGEVVVAGRKLIGSAQRTSDGVMLQHGSLLLQGDQRRVTEFVSGLSPSACERPAVLADFLDPLPEWDRLVHSLAAGFFELVGEALAPTPLPPTIAARAETLVDRYADLAWTFRL